MLVVLLELVLTPHLCAGNLYKCILRARRWTAAQARAEALAGGLALQPGQTVFAFMGEHLASVNTQAVGTVYSQVVPSPNPSSHSAAGGGSSVGGCSQAAEEDPRDERVR